VAKFDDSSAVGVADPVEISCNPAIGSPTGDALYCFCLARSAALPGGVPGEIHGEPCLEIIPFGDVAAVVAPVSREEFCGPGADTRLHDLAWVGPRACRHEAVVEAVMRTSPVIPGRFGTLFSDRERLASWVERHRVGVRAALDRFANHQEWAVKGTLDTGTAATRLLAARPARSSSARSPGAQYLQEQSIRAGIGEELQAWVSEVREQIAEQLLAHAVVDVCERALPAGAQGSRSGPILNWAVLVPGTKIDQLRACVQRLHRRYARQGVVLGCSGPWPPYSFCAPFEPNGEP
jgi:hypothetical protein